MVIVDGGWSWPPGTTDVDRWQPRCWTCGGPLDGDHREEVAWDAELGRWRHRLTCRACLASERASEAG